MTKRSDLECIKDAKCGIDLYFPIVGALHQKQRAALHIVFQCADKAFDAGDLSEAARLYHYLYTELQSLFHESPWSLSIPDYTDPPVPVDRWFTPDMLQRASIATSGTSAPDIPGAAAKLILLATPNALGSEIIGDLDEEYTTKVVPRFGQSFARKWYWKQAITTALYYIVIAPIDKVLRTCREIIIEITVRLLK